jgi:hypothetical protein
MESTTGNVVLFAFHDATRTAQLVSAVLDQAGVRATGVVGRSADCEFRIIGRVGTEISDVRWVASALAVLDVLSGSLGALAGLSRETEAVTLPDSANGYATFGRLIPERAVVVLVAFCDDSVRDIASFHHALGAGLARIPGDRAIWSSASARELAMDELVLEGADLHVPDGVGEAVR